MREVIWALWLAFALLEIFGARAAVFAQEDLKAAAAVDSVATESQRVRLAVDSSAQALPEETSVRTTWPDSQTVARTRALLSDALRETRENKDRTERMQGLVTVFPLLRVIDSTAAGEVLEEARLLAPQLPEGPSIWEIMGRAALEGAVIGALDIIAGGPSYMFPAGSFGRVVETSAMYPDHSEEYRAETIYARTMKLQLTLQTIEWLAMENPASALDLALLLKEDDVRLSALERTLNAWPARQSDTLIARVRALASPSQKKNPSSSLLAIAVAPYDHTLAHELALRAWREMGGKPIPIIFQALAQVDSNKANRHLEMLLRNPDITKDHLLGFARGAALSQPSLAWEALQGLTRQDEDYHEALVTFAESTVSSQPDLSWQALLRIDKNNTKFLTARGRLLRRLTPALPTDHKAAARAYAMELLTTPSYQPGGMKFSFKGSLRDEFRKLSAVTDALISLGMNDPDFALKQAEQVVFSEHLAQNFILERSGFLKKVNPLHSRIDPHDKPTKENLERTFFRDVAKLELALYLQQSSPHATLAILDSLDNTFWLALAYTALRQVMPEFDPIKEPDPEGLRSRLQRLVAHVKAIWPNLALADSGAIATPMDKQRYRFVEVSELMDRMAVAIFNDEKDWRWEWWKYLPFASAHAARGLLNKSPETAEQVFQTSISIAAELPSPAQEWARCWNAAALWESGRELPFGEGHKAALAAASLSKHDPWESSLPLLIHQIARLDLATAEKMAGDKKGTLVGTQSLVAIASTVWSGSERQH